MTRLNGGSIASSPTFEEELAEEDRCLFYNGIYRKKRYKPNKIKVDLELPAFPKVGLGNNCPMLNL